MRIILRRSAWASLLAGMMVLLPSLAMAQLEEVVVTAQKWEQSLQDVGISVTAFSAAQIENMGIDNTVGITQQIPGLQLSTWSPAFTIFSLRGISQNNFQDNLEAPVAVYMDGAYVASMNALNTQLFDMDRIEVLRGPQGTLFGRNATGGLIHFLTRKATEQELNGYLEAGAAEFSAYSVEGAVGGGISDRFRARLAGRWETSDGYLKPGTAFGRTATGRTSNGADGYALRGTAQFDATDAVVVDVTGTYSRDKDVPTGQYVVSLAGFDPNTGLGAFRNAIDPADPGAGPTSFDSRPINGDGWHHWSDEDTYMDRTLRSGTVQVTAELNSGMELVSISNVLSVDKFYIEDAGGGFGYFPYTTISAYEQLSQELRLSGDSGSLNWQLGAYYLDMQWDTSQSQAGALILSGVTGSLSDTQMISTYGDVDARNWSVFGHVEAELASAWTLIAGLRWSQDDKDIALRRLYSDVPEGVQPTEVFNIQAVAIPGVDEIDYGDYAARVQLNWTPIENQLVYVSFNRGIKGGNWSLDPLGSVADADLKHDPEKLHAYELGWKADLFDGLARLNSAAFFYDYKDYQAFSLVGLTPQVTNSDAEAYGGELELTLLPTGSLTLMLGAALLESEVDAVPDVFGGIVEAEFPNAPAISINFLARYEWPLFAGTLGAQVDGRWNDDQYLEGTNSEVSFEPAYSIWNASLTYLTNDNHIRVSAYVKNLGDEQYRLYNLDLGLLGFIEQMYAPPRQFGASVAYRW